VTLAPQYLVSTRFLLLVLLTGVGPDSAEAQVRVMPYAAGTLGFTDIGHRLFVGTSPSTEFVVRDHGKSILASLNVGARLGNHFALDAGLRTWIGIARPFRVLTVGPAISLGRRAKIGLRAGLGRLQGFHALDCLAFSGSCPRYRTEWVGGFDLAGNVEFPLGPRWSLGPTLWWAQSTERTQYRSLGLGAMVQYH
jgi:hypothetical protein